MRMQKSPLYRITAISILLLLTISGLLSGCTLFPQEDEPIPPPLIEVGQKDFVTKKPERGTIENAITGKASIIPANKVSVSFDEGTPSYPVASYKFKRGEYVEEGDLLCELDSSAMEKDITVYTLRYEIAEMVFANAERNYKLRIIDEIAWKRANVDIILARRTYNDFMDLYNTTRLYAPISGVITYMTSVEIGKTLPGREIIYTISDMTDLLIYYDGAKFDKLPYNATVEISSGVDENALVFTGTIIQTPDSVTDGDRSAAYHVLIRADIALPSNLEVGNQLILKYIIEHSEDTLIVPTHTVKTLGSRRYVYVLVEGIRQERDVKVGIVSGYETEILEGLSEDDLVIQ